MARASSVGMILWLFLQIVAGSFADDTPCNQAAEVVKTAVNITNINLTSWSVDELLQLDFGNAVNCRRMIFDVWNLSISSMDYHCVCNKLCINHKIPDRHKEHQTKAIKDMMCHYKTTFSSNVKAMTAVYALILITGIVGNLLVLITVARYLKQATVTNVFICSLSCADLLVVAINTPMKIFQITVGYWRLGKIPCYLMYYLLYTTFLCSVMTLTAMSIERYLAICHPMRAQYASTSGRAKKVVAAIWVSAFILGLPTIFVTNYYEPTWVCNIVLLTQAKYMAYALYLTVVIFLVPSCVMGVVYGQTSVTLWHSIKTSQGLQHSFQGNDGKGKTKEAQGRIQVIRMLLAVWIVFVVCWMPAMIIMVCDAFGADMLGMSKESQTLMTRAFTCLAYSNSCLNPFLYAFLSSHFRRGFINCFMACCGRRRREVDRMGLSSSVKTRMTALNKHHDTSVTFSKSDLSNSEPSNASN